MKSRGKLKSADQQSPTNTTEGDEMMFSPLGMQTVKDMLNMIALHEKEKTRLTQTIGLMVQN